MPKRYAYLSANGVPEKKFPEFKQTRTLHTDKITRITDILSYPHTSELSRLPGNSRKAAI